MTVIETVRSMSEEDTTKAIEAIHAGIAGDVTAVDVALKAMSRKGREALISVLQCAVEQGGVGA